MWCEEEHVLCLFKTFEVCLRRSRAPLTLDRLVIFELQALFLAISKARRTAKVPDQLEKYAADSKHLTVQIAISLVARYPVAVLCRCRSRLHYPNPYPNAGALSIDCMAFMCKLIPDRFRRWQTYSILVTNPQEASRCVSTNRVYAHVVNGVGAQSMFSQILIESQPAEDGQAPRRRHCLR